MSGLVAVMADRRFSRADLCTARAELTQTDQEPCAVMTVLGETDHGTSTRFLGGEDAVQRAGAPSWRFTESFLAHMPHVALYVRDAAGLAVPVDGTVPPRLSAGPAVRGDLLDDQGRQQAGLDWVSWWDELLEVEMRLHATYDGPDRDGWLRQLMDDRREIYDPPQFTALAGRPALRAAVLATFPDALSWDVHSQHPSPPHPGTSGGPARWFDHSLLASIAQDVATQHAVPQDAVRGAVLVLPVQGIWWRSAGAGAAVCSPQASQDPPPPPRS